jgi:hypothetical protein
VTSVSPTWLRRRRPEPGLDLEFIAYWALTGLFIGLGILVLAIQIQGYPDPAALFSDASLYYTATRTWVEGGNPWAVTSSSGTAFAGWPPTLLLNVPLLPFGPEFARVFWAVADVVGWIVLIWRLKLGPWWILFPPFVEALFPASPDPALAGAMVVGGAWLAALTKPYSIPSILADGHWRAVAVAAALTVASLLILPWAQFIAQLPAIQAALVEQSRDVSAWGEPVLMALVVVALASLGLTTALRLVVPTLWPSAQLHYSVFSARAGVESAALAVALAAPGYTAQLVVVIAVVYQARRILGRRRADPGREPATGTP